MSRSIVPELSKDLLLNKFLLQESLAEHFQTLSHFTRYSVRPSAHDATVLRLRLQINSTMQPVCNGSETFVRTQTYSLIVHQFN